MTEIAKREVTDLALVKRTVAPGATDDQLALFLHDCQRRGVHPLDKLIVSTAAGVKYTPITKIDYMRSRAAESGEMAGSDDASFAGDEAKPVSATVTVYRLTNGTKYAYSATARFREYYRNTPTWNHMPHTMIAKCAEALALSKAFPNQWASLYTRDEMQQAGAEDETETTELITPNNTALFNELDTQLAAAAEKGLNALAEIWGGLTPKEQQLMAPAKDNRHKPRAIEVSTHFDAAEPVATAPAPEGGGTERAAEPLHESASRPANSATKGRRK